MTHKLEGLRKAWEDATTQAGALERAREARKEEAKELQVELEAAALAGDSVECREFMDALRVIEERWAEIKAQHQARLGDATDAAKEIKTFYIEAAQEEGKVVDWLPYLVTAEKVIYSGWGRSWSAGQALIIDRELVEPELQAIQYMIAMVRGSNRTGVRVSLEPFEGKVRLRVMYPAYRGGCWTDWDGDRLLPILRPLFPREALGAEVSEFVSGLGVLK